MEAQSGDTADSRQASRANGIATTFVSASAYVRSHRNVMATVVVSAITAAVIVPYIATAGAANFGNIVTGQPVNSDASITESEPIMEQPERDTLRQTTGGSSNSSQTNVTVNGQSIQVPENGTYSKTTDDNNGHTEVRVESSHSSSSTGGSASNNSTVQLNVHSESHSTSGD